MLGDRIERYGGCFFYRISVHTRANSRKADCADTMLLSQFEASPIAAGKMRRLAVLAIAIDRTHGVKNMLGRQRSGRRHDSVPSGATSRGSANVVQLAHNGWAACTVNCSIHASSAAET